jgi:hypothetical protein
VSNRRPELALLLVLALATSCQSDDSDLCEDLAGPIVGGNAYGGINQPPTAPEVRISPESVSSADPFHCLVWTPSEDPDGDEVYYRFEWLENGEPQEINASAVHGWEAPKDSTWTCIVTPTDGKVDGPSAEASITIHFTGPDEPIIPPIVNILPEEPTTADDLECVIVKAAINPTGLQITYLFEWWVDDEPRLLDVSEVPASQTAVGEEWTCSVIPMVLPCDAGCEGKPGEDTELILESG